MKKLVTIEGMSCGHCVKRVQTALEALQGISEVYVDLENKTATFTGDVNDEVVKEAVEDAGYDVMSIQVK